MMDGLSFFLESVELFLRRIGLLFKVVVVVLVVVILMWIIMLLISEDGVGERVVVIVLVVLLVIVKLSLLVWIVFVISCRFVLFFESL